MVRIIEYYIARTPDYLVVRESFTCKVIVPGAFGGVAVGDISGVWQVPGLCVSITFIANAYSSMHMRDRWDRPKVACWGFCKGGACISANYPSSRICPVQGRVHGQQVGQVFAVDIDKIINPFDSHRYVDLSLDGQRWGVMNQQTVGRGGRNSAVPPYCRFRQASWEDLLLELFHRDFIIINGSIDNTGFRHNRWDE